MAAAAVASASSAASSSSAAAAAAVATPPTGSSDGSAALNALASQLQNVDAIMDPHILSTLTSFMSLKGDPKLAVKYLSESYRGRAQMANLIGSWIEFCGDTPSAVDDEVQALFQDLVMQRFDPQKADSIFEKLTTSPAWLDELITAADGGWRAVLVQLTARHPNCLMLKFAARKIAEFHAAQQLQAVNQKTGAAVASSSGAGSSGLSAVALSRLSSLGGTATAAGVGLSSPLALAAAQALEVHASFQPFSKLLCELLDRLLAAADNETELDASLPAFYKLCAQPPHVYLFTQRVLSALTLSLTAATTAAAGKPDTATAAALKRATALSPLIRRLSQGLSAYAVEHEGKKVLGLDFLLSGIQKYPQIASALSVLTRGDVLSSIDVQKLYALYSSADPAPVALIRSPAVFHGLIGALFNPSKPVAPAFKSKYIYLLAYVASVRDTRSTSEPTAATGHFYSDHSQSLESTITALTAVQEVCESKQYGLQPEHTFRVLSRHVSSSPLVAAAVIYWLRHYQWSDPNYFDTSYHHIVTPLLASVVTDICMRYPLLRESIFDLLSTAFQLTTALDALAQIELKRQLLQCMIHLIHCEGSTPAPLPIPSLSIGGSATAASPAGSVSSASLFVRIFHLIVEHAASMDRSLVRYFVISLISSIEPPYAVDFVRHLIQLLVLPASYAALKPLTLAPISLGSTSAVPAGSLSLSGITAPEGTAAAAGGGGSGAESVKRKQPLGSGLGPVDANKRQRTGGAAGAAGTAGTAAAGDQKDKSSGGDSEEREAMREFCSYVLADANRFNITKPERELLTQFVS